jgi:hypothetical protein
VKAVSGTLSHQMKPYVVDGNKMIQIRDAIEGFFLNKKNKVPVCLFELGFLLTNIIIIIFIFKALIKYLIKLQ